MTAVEVNAGGAVVKLRRPWVVGALSLIPFYWVFWYYAVNREMRDFGRARGNAALGESKPGLSVVAVRSAGRDRAGSWIYRSAGRGADRGVRAHRLVAA